MNDWQGTSFHHFIPSLKKKEIDFKNMCIFGNVPINKDAFAFNWRQGKV